MDPHLFSFALLPLLPPSLLILDCLCPLSPPHSFSCSYVIPSTLLSIRGPLYLSSPNVFIVAVFSGHVVVAAFVLVSHPLFYGAPRERINERFTFSPESTRLHSRARALCFAAIYYAPHSFLCIGARASSSLFPRTSQFFINDSLPFPSARLSIKL